MRIEICILLIISLFFNFGNAADSDGKEFVFAFIIDDVVDAPNSGALTGTVIIIPNSTDSICTFRYTKYSDNSVVSVRKTAYYGQNNEISFAYDQVFLDTSYPNYKFNDLSTKDFRIFASCTEVVKLIGKISDPIKSMGDIFLIPSTKNAGIEYQLGMPSTLTRSKGSFAILPINQGGTITINIFGYLNGNLFTQKTSQYDTTIGQDQHYVTVHPTYMDDDSRSTFFISASSPIMVAFASYNLVSDNNLDEGCGITCKPDYGTFMLSPLVPKQCNDLLFPPDQRLITNDFTSRVYVAPPSVSSKCNEVFSATFFDKNDNVNGDHIIITAYNRSFYDFGGKSPEMASSSYSGQMPMVRHGSVLNLPDTFTAYGHFLHYIPSILEWVTGKTQFYTLTKNCFMEFYADQEGSNADNIKIDGININNYDFTFKHMFYYKKTFGHFILELPGYGLHTIENSGNYVLYVVCKQVNGPYNAAGYLTGFNQRKQQ
uniref:IgGFc_binding domain-containing protein n=1 Tax=Rhabditophanes sp. KR3021 TaxID=114890 RepID=A0AC35UE73_9BILA